uniref:Uncharacterized protein n=1 Tax=Mycena chlorophos TaxID=658473 RepID=A0ABQ0LC77_MYCCL|nr:predicted protein [Mycena chlorophos]
MCLKPFPRKRVLFNRRSSTTTSPQFIAHYSEQALLAVIKEERSVPPLRHAATAANNLRTLDAGVGWVEDINGTLARISAKYNFLSRLRLQLSSTLFCAGVIVKLVRGSDLSQDSRSPRRASEPCVSLVHSIASGNATTTTRKRPSILTSTILLCGARKCLNRETCARPTDFDQLFSPTLTTIIYHCKQPTIITMSSTIVPAAFDLSASSSASSVSSSQLTFRERRGWTRWISFAPSSGPTIATLPRRRKRSSVASIDSSISAPAPVPAPQSNSERAAQVGDFIRKG